MAETATRCFLSLADPGFPGAGRAVQRLPRAARRQDRSRHHCAGDCGRGVPRQLLRLRAALGPPPGGALAQSVYPWITAGTLQVDVAFRVDPLSAVMMLIVSGVGFLIHVYSVGYMAHDDELRALLHLPEPVHLRDADAGAGRQSAVAVRRLGGRRAVLVSADRLLVRQRRRNANAGKKAFIVNRIGDAASCSACSCSSGTWAPGRTALSFGEIAAHAGEIPLGTVTAHLRCCCSSAPPGSRRSCRCTSGCPTPWPARRRSAH